MVTVIYPLPLKRGAFLNCFAALSVYIKNTEKDNFEYNELKNKDASEKRQLP